MKVIAFLAALSLTSLVTAAPIRANVPRGIIPKPRDLVEMMFPHSGIPKVAGKLEKDIGVCTCIACQKVMLAFMGLTRFGNLGPFVRGDLRCIRAGLLI